MDPAGPHRHRRQRRYHNLLACVVDEIVVEGRELITQYFFSPGVLIPFPSRRLTGIEPRLGALAPTSVLKARPALAPTVSTPGRWRDGSVTACSGK
jgi:hypothetical protein